MAEIALSNLAGFGFNMKTDDEGFFIVTDDSSQHETLTYDDGRTALYSVTGNPSMDSFGVNYTFSGNDVTIEDVIYWNNDFEVLSILNVDLHTTVDDLVNGTAWSVRLNAQDDIWRGNRFRDVIRAGYGNDTVYGNGGNDTLYGEAGRDRLVGGKGADKLHGGADNVTDIFVFAADDTGTGAGRFDQVFDFHRDTDARAGKRSAGSDRIDLSGIDADTAPGHQDLRFVLKFTKAAKGQPDGQFRVVDAGKHVNVEIDLDGDRHADMMIQVMNVAKLSMDDFAL